MPLSKDELAGLLSHDDIYEISYKKPVTFIHGDNMQFLRYCKDNLMWKYFHVGIVDPPYGISVGNMMLGAATMDKHREKQYEMGKWDNEVPTAEYWELLDYCCRNLIVWGGNYFSNFLRPGRCCLAWDKMNNGMSFSDFELALTTFDKSARVIRKSRNKKEEDGDKRHPTQKPVYLYDYMHLEFVEKNQRVLDTHGGSHSHAIAAFKNNVDLTIIEREKSYYLSGIEEYEAASKKPRLFF